MVPTRSCGGVQAPVAAMPPWRSLKTLEVLLPCNLVTTTGACLACVDRYFFLPSRSRMNILFIGDIFASAGRGLVARNLQDIITEEKIQLAVANAENSAGGFGITPLIAEELFSVGLDILTSGNHIWDKKEIFDYLPRQPRLIRPANYPAELPGQGLIVTKARHS